MIDQSIKKLQTKSGRYTIAAFDQRGSFAKILGLDYTKPEHVEHMKQLKKAMIQEFSQICSAVLTDPEYGLDSLSEKHPDAGLLMPAEKSSYETVEQNNLPEFYDTWGVEQIVEQGAAVKFLIFYHPESVNTDKKAAIVRHLHEKTSELGSAFVLEPLLHKIEGKETTFDHYMRMTESFRDDAEVLKIEYPVLFGETVSKEEQISRLKTITQTVGKTPWILLSRGVEFEMFVDQLKLAMEHGASGFAAGRAVWKEVGEHSDLDSQRKFIRTTAVDRMKKLIELVS